MKKFRKLLIVNLIIMLCALLGLFLTGIGVVNLVKEVIVLLILSGIYCIFLIGYLIRIVMKDKE